MTKRDIIHAVLDGRRPPYVPWSFSFTLEAREKLVAHFGTDDLEPILDNHLLGLGNDIGFFEEIGNDRVRDVFGVVWNRSVDKDIGDVEHPQLTEPTLESYTFPDPRDDRFFANIPSQLARYGDRFRVFRIGFSLYERAWTLRGMEALMMDFIDHPKFVKELLRCIADYNIAQVEKALTYDIDAVYFGDDWGQQHGLIMGPTLWHEFIYPELKRMYGVVRGAGKKVFIHSCGDVDELFDDLVAIGLNCFNPFQPEVMDVAKLIPNYRGRLAFHGGLSTQRTLPYGTVEDVRDESRKMLSLGEQGSYIFAPAHAVEGDVPLENMLAFIETAQAQDGYMKTRTRLKERTLKRSPNVLFILSDQHNAKCLGHKGHPDVKTPHLDRLAAEGVRFDNAITQNAICTPSRMCFISGQYAHNHGYYGLSGPNPNGLPTIFGHFRAHGYRTAAIGKIHCPEYWVEDDCDVFHETEPSASIGGRSGAYTQHLRSKDIEHLEDHHSLTEFGRRGAQSCDGRPSKVSYRDGQEGWSVTQGIAFMEQAKADRTPFFLHISLPKPHQCYTPAQEFWDLYDQEKLTLPPNADFGGPLRAPHLAKMADGWRRGGWARFEPKTFEAARLRKLHGYYGNISHVDHAVGELVDLLDANGLGEDTIIVYSADHGDYAAEHGIMEKAPGICHDAITRIPYIWRWSGQFDAGHMAEELVETVDMSATLCSLCGVPPLETSDGRDISHLLHGESGEVHEIAVTEFAWSKSVRKGDWRFVYYPPEMFRDEYPSGFGELYNLAKDPWEMDNLYFADEHQDRIRELQADLLNWLITTTRPVSTNCADLADGPQRCKRYGVVVNADNKIHPDNLRAVNYKNYL